MKTIKLYRYAEYYLTLKRLISADFLKGLVFIFLLQSLPVYAIYQGKPVAKDELPYVVSLQSIRDDNVVAGHYCTASLIAPRFVLTAAHCISNDNKLETQVLIKVKNLETDTGLLFDIKHFIPHPNYHVFGTNTVGRADDIMLLELTEPVDLPLVKLAPLPLSNYINTGASLIGVGWGVTDNNGTRATFLKKANIQLLSEQKSLQIWPDIVNSQFGTKGIDGNACGGDSGGPVLLMEQEQLIQVGIFKAGTKLCSNELSAVTRLDSYLEWIEKEQRLSYPRAKLIDIVIVGQTLQQRIEIKNNHQENLPLNDFSFSALSQDALIGEIDILADACSGQSLNPEQTCAIDISFTLARSGAGEIKFSSPTSSDAFPAILGLLEYSGVDVEDVSLIIHQGVNSDKLTFKGNFAENWQVRNDNNSVNGVVAALPLSGGLERDYARLIVELAGKGKVAIKLAIENLASSGSESELWFTLNNKIVPISVASHFVQKGATDGFINIEIPITKEQSELVLHLWSRIKDSTLLLEQFDFVAEDNQEPEPEPEPKPEPEESPSSGGGSGPLLLFLALTVFTLRLNKVERF